MCGCDCACVVCVGLGGLLGVGVRAGVVAFVVLVGCVLLCDRYGVFNGGASREICSCVFVGSVRGV